MFHTLWDVFAFRATLSARTVEYADCISALGNVKNRSKLWREWEANFWRRRESEEKAVCECTKSASWLLSDLGQDTLFRVASHRWMTTVIRNYLKNRMSQIFCTGVEPPEMGMVLYPTPGGNKRAIRVWELVDWETCGGKGVSWTQAMKMLGQIITYNWQCEGELRKRDS